MSDSEFVSYGPAMSLAYLWQGNVMWKEGNGLGIREFSVRVLIAKAFYWTLATTRRASHYVECVTARPL